MVAPQQLLEKLRQQQQQASGAHHASRDALLTLQKEIKAGNSTGDALTDYVILHFGGDTTVEGKIRDLQDKLKANDGKLVALEEVYSYSWGESGCFGGGISDSPALISVGRIREPYLKLEQNTDNFLNKMVTRGFCDMELVVDPCLTLQGEGRLYKDHSYLMLEERPQLHRNKNIEVVLSMYLNGTGSEQHAHSRMEAILGHDTRRRAGFRGEKTKESVLAYRLYVGEEVDTYFEKLHLIWMHTEGPKPKTTQWYKEHRSLLLDDKALAAYEQEEARKLEQERIAKQDDLVGKILRYQGQDQGMASLLQEALTLEIDKEKRELDYLPGSKVKVGELVSGLCEKYGVKKEK